MNERIEELLEKYWEAKSTLAEEQELKLLLGKSEGYEAEKLLFDGLNDMAHEEPDIKMPARVVALNSRKWIGWAASVAILIGSGLGYRAYEQKQAEAEAYQEVMQAFALIQNNLAKGQEQMQPIKELRYLNTTNQLFGNPKIN